MQIFDRRMKVSEIFDFAEIIGKEITIGFGRLADGQVDNNRLVIDKGNGNGVTLFAGKEKIEAAEFEPISIAITPSGIICDDVGEMIPGYIVFKLGRHRFLAAIFNKEGVLRIVYLPDENDYETCSSEFLNRIWGQ
jgi:hypothetical protein